MWTVDMGMWIKLCEVTSSAVSRTDAKANSFIRELGLSWCLSTPSLCWWSTLHLLLKFVNLGYRQEKAKLVMELKDSSNEMMKYMQASVVAEGRKIKRLQHQEVVGKTKVAKKQLARWIIWKVVASWAIDWENF